MSVGRITRVIDEFSGVFGTRNGGLKFVGNLNNADDIAKRGIKTC